MPSNFPDGADTFPTAADLADDTLATKPHSELHEALGDAVAAIQAAILTIGKLTGATPWGEAGLFSKDSTVPADGGWADLTLETDYTEWVIGNKAIGPFLYTAVDRTNADFVATKVDAFAQWNNDTDTNTEVFGYAYAGGAGAVGALPTPVFAPVDAGYSRLATLVLRANPNPVGQPGQPGFEFACTDKSASVAFVPVNGQTSPIWVVKDPVGLVNNLFAVRPNGQVISNAHVAPADGDLNPGDFALYLDPTPGSSAIMAKAKDTNGTVVGGMLGSLA